jgi:hypothetical protein
MSADASVAAVVTRTSLRGCIGEHPNVVLKVLRLRTSSPNLNTFAERFVLSRIHVRPFARTPGGAGGLDNLRAHTGWFDSPLTPS